MRNFVLAAILPLAVSCAALGFRPTAGEGSPPSVFVRSIETDSEKAVAVVTDPRFDEHQARAVDVASFRRALMNSGLFTDEDVASLSAPIAAAMSEMSGPEKVRVLAWAHDGIRRYYLFLHGETLHVVYFRGDVEVDRHQSVVKSYEVAGAASTPTPVGTQAVAPHESPTPAPAATVAKAAATPRVTTSPTPTPDRRRTEVVMASRLSEGEVREKIQELRSLQEQGLITGDEYKRKVKDTLNRL